MKHVKTGLEVFAKNPHKSLDFKKIGLLCNPASVNNNFTHASTIINTLFPGQLTALFSPQHGFSADKQDNMIESENITDPVLNIPIFSLYSTTRVPLKEMMDTIDVLLIDLQDTGTRVYTFIYTMSLCLEAARLYNKEVIILDRPNPISGAIIEGNCIKDDCKSFVGRYNIPMRHGLTIGELSLLFNNEYKIGCNLSVIKMYGWKRNMFFYETGLPWVPPSPNIPTINSAMVYPGQVIWEATNISEGRGTTLPFEIFGAPFIDPEKINKHIQEIDFPGIVLRQLSFEPTSGKWANQLCHGFHIHITDPLKYKPYKTSLILLQIIIKLFQKKFRWKEPPYEYEYIRLPASLIIGDNNILKKITNQINIDQLEQSWQKDLINFKNISEKYFLY